MNRHNAFTNGFGVSKKYDDHLHHHRKDSDLENKHIWNVNDLVEDDVNEHASFRKFEPRHRARNAREVQWRSAKRVAAALVALLSLLYFFGVFSSSEISNRNRVYEIETVRYYDLEDVQGTSLGWQREERVLLCTPLRDASAHLSMFFGHLRNLTYPHKLIDLAFLVSDSKDDTKEALNAQLELLQKDPAPGMPFGEISVIHKDFGQKVGQDSESRHGFAVQARRRKLMAQARNWLLSAALRPYHSWVYWRDADVETCPSDIIEDLMRHDKDIIVPNVWRPLPDWLGGEQPYDLNSWQESETAIALAETLDEDAVIVEGYAEYATWRPHLAYLRDPYGDPDVEMELDGVGGVSILSKARVFRAGVHFPAFSFERHAETEGFGKMAKRMQFSVVGLPHYTIWHLYEPSVDDIRHMEEMEKEKKEREKQEQEKNAAKMKLEKGFQDPKDQWEKDKAVLGEEKDKELNEKMKQKAEKARTGNKVKPDGNPAKVEEEKQKQGSKQEIEAGNGKEKTTSEDKLDKLQKSGSKDEATKDNVKEMDSAGKNQKET